MIVQVYAPTTSYSEEGIISFYNDVDGTLEKRQCASKENNETYGNGNGQIWARIEK